MTYHFHMGRAWVGHEVEDSCPCPKAPCGLAMPGAAPEIVCEQHNPANWIDSKTMRQMHDSDHCPARQTPGDLGTVR